MFDTIKVRLLRSFDKDEEGDAFYQKGTIVIGWRWPSGVWDLLDPDKFDQTTPYFGVVFCPDAKENEDFERIW